ncbi:MAG: hypothetical protein AAF725_14370 [Acidobacteriota bacterium]
MTTLALVNATDLVAEEFRAALEERHDLWNAMRLFTTEEDAVGTLVDVRGGAGMVVAVEDGSFDDVDIALFFGEPSSYRNLLASVPPAATTILVTGKDPLPEAGQPGVVGVNLHDLDRFETLVHPHSAAVGIAQLLRPLLPLNPRSASATAVLPVSFFGKEALDELLDQARDLLSFSTQVEADLLPGPLAFNVLDSPTGRLITDQARAALGEDAPPLAVQAVQGGLFHGLGLALQITFEDETLDAERLTEVLEGSSLLDFAADPEQLGPKEVVGRLEVMISEIRPLGEGIFALWAVLDPLTAGGSRNLLAMLESLKNPHSTAGSGAALTH